MEIAATLKGPRVHQLAWWQIPSAWADAATTWADPFVVGFVFPMMLAGEDVHVEGRLSPSLLANLELYMAIWEAWRPGRYRAIKLSADELVESPVSPNNKTLVPFSGGVDSCFTTWRNSQKLIGPRSRELEAAIVIRGFDIPLDRPDGDRQYQKLLAGAQAMLSSVNLACIPIRTNLRQLPIRWEELHGTALAASLLLFSGRFHGGLISNTIAVTQLGTLWGTHPVIDRLLGSANFPIADDGMESPRWRKIAALADWPAARKHLHVCFKGIAPDGSPANCCTCEKCIRTILAARVAGKPRFESFASDVTPRQIRGAYLNTELNIGFWTELRNCLENSPERNAPWARAVRHALRCGWRRKWRKDLLQPLVRYRNKIRQLFRGTEKSRREQRELADLLNNPST